MRLIKINSLEHLRTTHLIQASTFAKEVQRGLSKAEKHGTLLSVDSGVIVGSQLCTAGPTAITFSAPLPRRPASPSHPAPRRRSTRGRVTAAAIAIPAAAAFTGPNPTASATAQRPTDALLLTKAPPVHEPHRRIDRRTNSLRRTLG
jgi:hypothetical protein